ncbi:MAG: glycosyl hydrolase family 18 protein [Burkholderiaceae bacterium]|nr:glycosyl hydrolase family 18 protein [Burkholderiaceae bacterium]
MILRCLHLGFFLAIFLFQSMAMAEAPQAWAYLGWWLPDSWRAAPLVEFDRLLFFEIKVDSSGKIAERNGWPEKWTDLRLAVKKHNTPLDLTLTLLDPTTFNRLFASVEAMQRLLDEAASLANQEDVAGLQLDFEIYSLVPPETIKRYQSFVGALSRRLHQLSPSRNLSVFFPMGGESLLYHAATLEQVDQVVLQGYDAHWIGSKTAGPVAPLNGNESVTWKKAVSQGIALGVPKERLLLSFPLYGYEWPVKGRKLRSATVGQGVHTSFAPIPAGLFPDFQFNVQDQVRQYGATHDPVSGSSYYQFKRKNGQFVEGWFEDWWTLGRKSDYLADEQLGGIAFFMLGYDNGQLIDYFLRRRGAKSRQGITN